MFANKTSKEFQRIILNETCLSWVLRGVSQKKLVSPHLFRQVIYQGLLTPKRNAFGVVDPWPFPDIEDIEFDHGSSLYSTVSEVLGFSSMYLTHFFGPMPQRLTHISTRKLYCTECFKESMLLHGFPVWKQSWCYATTACCAEHLNLLMSPRNNPEPKSRIWDCYVHSLSRRDRCISVYERRVAGLIARVQHWIQALETTNTVSKHAVLNLYAVLLSKRTIFSPQGLAAAIFGWHQSVICHMYLSIQERLEFGVHNSDARERGGALLMIGWLIEKVSEQEFSYVINGAFCSKGIAPHSPELFGRMIAQLCTKEEAGYVRQSLSDLQHYRTKNISEFLKGMDAAVNSMR